MSVNITKEFNFDNINNYVLDQNKIELNNSLIKLKATVIGAEAKLYAKLDDNKGLVAIDSSGNNNHGAFQGGYSENQWVAGKINSAINGLSTTSGFINFDKLVEYERTDAFSLECWMKTTSTATMTLIAKQINSNPFTGFAINMIAGKVRQVIRDSSSNVISKEHNVAINDNNWHHIVFTYDGSSIEAGCKLYIDNTQNNSVIATGTLTSTIKNTTNFQVSGREGNNNCIDPNTSIDEVVVYSRELTPAEIEIRWNNGNGTQIIPGASTSYPIDNPIVVPIGTTKVTNIISLAEDVQKTGNDDIRYSLNLDGTNYYYNGSIWTNSFGYNETNSILDINNNVGTLPIELSSEVNINIFLHSGDGSTTPELTKLSITYNSEEVVEPANNLISVQRIRDILEGYCIIASTISDDWIENRRDKYVIPTIINKRLGLSISGDLTKDVYLNGTGKDVLILPERNIQELLDIQYVNTQSVYTPSLANFILIEEEGILKAKYNFNESFIDPVFPKGTRNIKITYKVGYPSDNIPDDLNELIGYLTVLEILKWIEGRSGGGNVSSQSFNRQYGDRGKYTNIRREITQNCNIITQNYRTSVV